MRSDIDSAVAKGRNWTLPVQCLRPLPQDERNESATGQATTAPGKQGAMVPALVIREKLNFLFFFFHRGIAREKFFTHWEGERERHRDNKKIGKFGNETKLGASHIFSFNKFLVLNKSQFRHLWIFVIVLNSVGVQGSNLLTAPNCISFLRKYENILGHEDFFSTIITKFISRA